MICQQLTTQQGKDFGESLPQAFRRRKHFNFQDSYAWLPNVFGSSIWDEFFSVKHEQGRMLSSIALELSPAPLQDCQSNPQLPISEHHLICLWISGNRLRILPPLGLEMQTERKTFTHGQETLGLSRCSDHGRPLFVSRHWLRLPSRIQHRRLVLTFKAFHGLAPPCLSSCSCP